MFDKYLKEKALSVALAATMLLGGCSLFTRDGYAGLSTETQSIVTQDYAAALDSFAMAVPHIGKDTESYWAEDMVHNMATQLAEDTLGRITFEQKLATIYLMQSHIGYGMAYIDALKVATNGAPAQWEAWQVLNYRHDCDSIYSMVKEGGFGNTAKVAEMGYYSLFMMQLYCHLNRCDNAVVDESRDASLALRRYFCDVTDSIAATGGYKEKELEKITLVLHETLYYTAFAPMIYMLCKGEPDFEEQEHWLSEMAKCIDEQSTPIINAIVEGTKIPLPSDNEMNDFVQTTTRYKILLLRAATASAQR